MKIFISESYDDTISFAEEFAKKLPKGTVIAYLGDLGAGKTAFTSGLAKGLGIKCDVFSPTFAICNEYHSDKNTLYHFDMYRINGWDDLYSTAFFDYLGTDAYMAIEWSENIFGAIPDDSVIVEILKLNENKRKIRIYNKGDIK
ncbi:MAG: tRNA (adenosine(37)-N6)-threonylcarbamoyltransferase complex ATPase subunit type 1 TsaE [Clostridiales bacterium]|nr:tRNA (adenosine(37)-N6)-threonylcarbamoyltransferase complex ATPase subunit type 1 TsaE [Clostridiales bacterium]